jgi:hypothetical protein
MAKSRPERSEGTIKINDSLQIRRCVQDRMLPGQLNNLLSLIQLTLCHVQVFILGDSDIFFSEVYFQLCYTCVSRYAADEEPGEGFSGENAGAKRCFAELSATSGISAKIKSHRKRRLH